MASLAILQVCFEYMSEKTLEDNMNVGNVSIVFSLIHSVLLGLL